MNSSNDYEIRLAVPADALQISLLYKIIYGGKYPDRVVTDANLLTDFIAARDNLWVVATRGAQIVGSVAYEVDSRNRLAKVFGGVVLAECRGAGLLQSLMQFGADEIRDSVDIVYATTRTASTAPQVITETMGYKKLGIFPNVHRTDTYETHCLTACFCNSCLSRRFTGYRLHPDVQSLYDITSRECGLDPLPVADASEISLEACEKPIFELEVIDAPQFILRRFRHLTETGQLPFCFYPFHEPTILITSPCRSVELFLHVATADKYCTIVGIRKPNELDFGGIWPRVSDLLRDRGVRYIESLVRADKIRTIQSMLLTGFVPCAFFPAFQLHDSVRYDYVVLSFTFEILDFRRLKLAGLNKVYLENYFLNWRRLFLDPVLLAKEQQE